VHCDFAGRYSQYFNLYSRARAERRPFPCCCVARVCYVRRLGIARATGIQTRVHVTRCYTGPFGVTVASH
jgi:hypothetical protein